MESFIVPSVTGQGALEFLERTPQSTQQPLERFKVRLRDLELTALGRVYSSPGEFHPASLFARMAASWRGWDGELVWGPSSQGELELRCTQDRCGHVRIGVVLRSGPSENDWEVKTTVMTEAGQLEELARQAAAFFGPSA